NLFGAVVGAFILVLLPEVLKFLDLPVGTADLMRNAFYGLMLIVILRFRPEGLFPERYRYTLPAGAQSAGAQSAGAQSAGGTFQLAPLANAGDRAVTLAGADLHKNFGGIVAANGVDIELRAGQVTGLIGPNGAGKTTAFNLLTGFLTPTSGTITLRGRPITDRRPHRIVHSGVARSFQDLKLFRRMTVLENILVAFPNQLGDKLHNVYFRPLTVAAQERANIGRALEILDFVGLRERALEEADGLSYAEEKLLVIARLLATEAEVLLLDEPLSGLDPNTLARVLPIVRRLAAQGRTACPIEHNLDVIREVCDVAAYLDGGRVLAVGRPEDLMKDPQLLERYIQ
ncbi:MAG TPA: ATP-binding cassette domain-containing protein, partial [Thalassobaculum sp.]